MANPVIEMQIEGVENFIQANAQQQQVKPVYVDMEFDTGENQYIKTAPEPSIFSRAVTGLKKLVGIDTAEKKYDFAKLLAIEKYGTASEVNVARVLRDYNTGALKQHEIESVISGFMHEASLGFLPEEQAGTPVGALGEGITSFAGMLLPYAMATRGMGMVAKLAEPYKYIGDIVKFFKQEGIIRNAVKQGIGFGGYTLFMDRIADRIETYDSLAGAIKGHTTEALMNTIVAGGFPFLSYFDNIIKNSMANKALKGVIAVAGGNLIEKGFTGEASAVQALGALAKQDYLTLTRTLFNTALYLYFGLTEGHKNFEKIPEDIRKDITEEGLTEVLQQTGNIINDITTQAQHIKYVDFVKEKVDSFNIDEVKKPKEQLLNELKALKEANDMEAVADKIVELKTEHPDIKQEEIDAIVFDEDGQVKEVAETVEAVENVKQLYNEEDDLFDVFGGSETESRKDDLIDILKEEAKKIKGFKKKIDISGNEYIVINLKNMTDKQFKEYSKKAGSKKISDIIDYFKNKTNVNAVIDRRGKLHLFEDKIQGMSGKDVFDWEYDYGEDSWTQKVYDEGGLDIEKVKKTYPQIVEDIHRGIVNKHGKWDVDEMAQQLGLESGEDLIEKLKREKGKVKLKATKLYGGLPIDEIIEGTKRIAKQLKEKGTIEIDPTDAHPYHYIFFTPFQLRFEKGEVAEVFRKAFDTYFDITETVNMLKSNFIMEHIKPIEKVLFKDKKLRDVFFKYVIKGDELQKDPKELLRQDIEANKVKLTPEEIDKLNELFTNHKQFYDKWLKIIKEKVIKEKDKIVDKIFEVTDINKVKAVELSQKLEKITNAILRDIKEYPYYMHRQRKQGNIKVTIRKGKKKVFEKFYNDPTLLLFKSSPYAKALEVSLRKQYPEKDGYKIEFTQYSKNEVKKFDAFELIDWLKGIVENKDLQLTDKQKVELIDKAYDALASQGFMATSIRRKEELVKGYEEDALKVMKDYMNKAGGWLIKQDLRNALGEIEKSISPQNVKIRKMFDNWRDEVLRNLDVFDLWVGKIRGLMFLRYIAGLLRPVVVNLLNTPIITVGHLTSLLGGGIKSIPKAHKIAMKSASMALKVMYDIKPKDLTDTEWAVMQELKKRGVFTAQHTSFIMGKTGLTADLMDRFNYMVGAGFSKSEEFNRVVSALSFVLAKRGSGLSKEALMYGAREFAYLTNGVYGKMNMPLWLSGSNEVKQLFKAGYTFHGYNQQMLLAMLKLFKEGNAAGLLHSLGMVLLFGGAAALPFFNTVNMAYKEATGEDLRFVLKQKIKDWLGDTAGDIFDGGLPKLLGVELTGSLAFQSPIDTWEYSENLADFILDKAFGVMWSTVKDGKRALEYLAHGNIQKAFQYGAPMKALSYSIDAAYGYLIGFTTKGEIQLIDPLTGDTIKYKGHEALFRMLGFTPERVAEFKRDIGYFQTLYQHYADIRQRLYRRARYYRERGKWDKFNKTLREMTELNQKLVDKQLVGIIPFASATKIDRKPITVNYINWIINKARKE